MESLTNKLEIFTDFKVKYNIVWDTWKYKYSIIKTNYVITVVSYRGVCSHGADYIGEALCNSWLQRNEHENVTDKNLECAKRLIENDNH